MFDNKNVSSPLLTVGQKYAVFANRDGLSLRILDAKFSFLSIPIPISSSNVLAIEVDWDRSKVYWIDSLSAVIYRADLLSGEKEVIVDKGLVRPTAIALDWAGQKLYWADSGTCRIEVSHTDGSSRKVIVQGNEVDEVTTMAVNLWQ